MLRVARSIHINGTLANALTHNQRSYAVTSRKTIKLVDEKLTPPKKPLTAYLQFHQEVFNTLSPEEKSNIIASSKTISERWRKLSEQEKKHYQAIAQKDKEDYEGKCKEFVDSLTPADFIKLAQIRKLSKAKGKSFPRFKDPNAPRKPMTSYVYFLKEKYPQLNAGNSTDAFRKIAEEWHQIPESNKKHYEQLAAEDKLRYEKELKEYMQ